MNENPAKFAAVGPGAVGGATAALLSRAGYDVTLACKNAEAAERSAGAVLSATGVR